MGRTNPTFRNWLERYESQWYPFRRALREEHQSDFDRVFERAVEHAGPAGYQNASTPELAMMMSVLVSQERELRMLREHVESE